MSHCIEVEYEDGRIGCFSYGVPVAAFIPIDYARDHGMAMHGWITTDHRYSTTTTKHMNAFAPKDNRTEVHDVTLRKLLSPIRRVK